MDYSNLKVFLYWDKYTWYALGALSASLQKHQIPYEVIKGNVKQPISKALNTDYRVIYAESSRSWTIEALKNRLKIIKKAFTSADILVVVGGPHATGVPEEILNMGGDVVVIGEGEETFPHLVKTFAQKPITNGDLETIPGIAYLDQYKTVQRTKRRPSIDLDSYCPYSDNPKFSIHPPIELMRGCAFRCRFCQVPYMYGNPRFRSIKNIETIVKHYISHFKPIKKTVDIRFIAPNSLGYMEKKRGIPNVSRLKELIDCLTQYDIRLFFGTFPSEVRPEYITEETISLFEKISNNSISIGFQSGSDNILTNMRREHTVQDGLAAYEIMKSHGYLPVFDFILGTPSETLSAQWETLDFVRQFQGKALVRLHYFMPLPGTPWQDLIPVPLSSEILTEIGRLAKAKIITGEFVKQMNQIEKLLESRNPQVLSNS